MTNIGDSGAGSLRQAIIDTNISPTDNTITFDTTLFKSAQTIALTTGELTITDSLTILGPSARVTVNANAMSRVFRLENSASAVNFSDVNIKDGEVTNEDGAGLKIASGTVTLTRCDVSDHAIAGNQGIGAFSGAGIFAGSASVTLTDCSLNNTGGFISGGGIAAGTTTGITGGVITVEGCSFSNDIEYDGGGIYMPNGGTLVVKNSVFNGQMIDFQRGGGIFAKDVASTIENTTFTANSANGDGGGLYIDGGSIQLSNCTLDNNKSVAGNGGGMLVKSAASVLLKNCTIASNTAVQGGGVFVIGRGATVVDSVQFYNCTITNNTAFGNALTKQNPWGGGIFLEGFDESDTILLDSTIVASNILGAGTTIGPDIFGDGVTVQEQFSLIGFAGSGKFILVETVPNSNKNNTVPGFSPAGLSDNGGPTRTIALMPDSVAIDAGENKLALSTDERGAGFVREVQGKPGLQGDLADMGAFELQKAASVQSLVTYAENGAGKVANTSESHSRITSIVVTFSQPVVLPATQASAFLLQKLPAGSGTVTLNAALAPDGLSAELTFIPSAAELTEATDTFGRPSLADGNYRLTIFAAKVTSFGAYLDGNADGFAGVDYATAATGSSAMYRLFGDDRGNDRTVDNIDYQQFLAAYGTSGAVFDADGDGDTDSADFQAFRARQLGAPLPTP